MWITFLKLEKSEPKLTPKNKLPMKSLVITHPDDEVLGVMNFI